MWSKVMTSALTLKELRELAGVAALGLAALLVVALTPMGMSPVPGLLQPARGGEIPFLFDSFLFQFVLAAGGLAMALGFVQALRDFAGQTHLFLLHRPISRGRIYTTKIAV